MSSARESTMTEPPSELAVVDTFTKLIFGQENEYSASEELIIQALRLVDNSVALDDYREMGHYLRALSVEEMIGLVTRVQLCLSAGAQARVQRRNDTLARPPSTPVRASGHRR